jgi:hypothetical protein
VKIRAPFRIERLKTQYGPATLVKSWGIVRTLHLTREQLVRRMSFRWDYRVTDAKLVSEP